MNSPVRGDVAVVPAYEIVRAHSPALRDDIFRFRYRIYVEQMNRRQKYADHRRKIIEEPLDEQGENFGAYLHGRLVGVIRGNRLSDAAARYYQKIYKVDGRFNYEASQMSLTTKLMFEPALQRSVYPIKLVLHYARHFHYGGGHRIDFLDCNKHLIPLFRKLGYLDYQGWIVHNEYGTVRPLCCPADQLARFGEIRSSLLSIARDYYRNDQFGGDTLARRLDDEGPRR